jgi:aspartyl-tRNA(Asn)/glutamyl-tRNA(Gln) amidotransferase subunit C
MSSARAWLPSTKTPSVPLTPPDQAAVTPLCYNLIGMALTLEQVRHIAHLARLRLTADEEGRYREQLSAILDYAARLAQVDTAAIPPTATVLPLHAPLRPDEPRPGLATEAVLANAPASEDGMFRIPPVFERGA